MAMVKTKLIADEAIEEALQYLATSSEMAAAARAARLRGEFERKRVRSRLILQSNEKTMGMKEAWAECHPDYVSACEAELKAFEADEYYRNKRNACDAIIEAWRSEQANNRAGSSFK